MHSEHELTAEPNVVHSSFGREGQGPGREAPNHGGEANGVERASLDKVREIVLGPYARDVDRRITRLEQTFERELGQLRDQVERRLDTLDRFVRAETASLAESIAEERQARAADFEQQGAEQRRIERQAQERHTDLADRIARVARELRELVLAEASGLREQLGTAERTLGRTLSERSRDLEHAKTDRVQLASMLAELAHRLAGDDEAGAR